MGKTGVDQKSIADQLGISQSTVARVLKHDPLFRVSPETRDSVLRVAADMGYKPRKRRTHNIAFIVCGPAYYADFRTQIAACMEAEKYRYRMIFIQKDTAPTYGEIKLSVNPLSVDGAIISGQLAPEMASRLAEVLPVVTVGQHPYRTGVDWVKADTRLLARQMTEHILACGHKRIGIFIEAFDDFMSKEFLAGYQDALAAAGIEYDRSQIWEMEDRFYPEMVHQFMDHDPRLTALFAMVAGHHPYMILAALNGMGVRVPEDLEFAAWSGTIIDNPRIPRLTQLEDLHESTARTAIRRLMDRIEDPLLPPSEITVPVSISKGETCCYGPQTKQNQQAGK